MVWKGIFCRFAKNNRESESNQESELDKFNRVDIKAENSKGHLIIVEVQVSRDYDFLKRILYGLSKTITEHIQLGDRYEKVKKVYSISIHISAILTTSWCRIPYWTLPERKDGKKAARKAERKAVRKVE